MNNRIQLTETELRHIIEESVKQCLIQEGIWDGIKNVARGAWDATKAVGNNVGAMYYNGVANGQIERLQQMQQQYQERIKEIQMQIQQLQQKAQNKRETAQGNMQSFRNRMNPNFNYNQTQNQY